MNDYHYTKLKIDEVFKNLIPPLSQDEYKQLEENLMSDGCREPICIWNGTIIDGHNRYEICIRHHIPFNTQQIQLESRNEAICWICANQIGRRNITEEARKYLIGKRYESEKYVGSLNVEGRNQFSLDNEVRPKIWGEPPSATTRSKTARKLGEEYHLSHATIEKYGTYTRAIDTLAEKDKALVPRILSGQTKISYENVIELSKLPTQELKRISKQLIKNDRNFVGYASSRRDIEHRHRNSNTSPLSATDVSVKDMPAFDPDAEIYSLTLTIPSWISSINRTGAATDLALVTDRAKNKLLCMLENLEESAGTLRSRIKR